MVFVWFWVGLAVVQAVFGNAWATLSPFETLGRLLQLYPRCTGRRASTRSRSGGGRRLCCCSGPSGFELASPFADEPRALGIAIVAYTALTVAGMAVFGRAAWLENGEAFGVDFGLLAISDPLGLGWNLFGTARW